MEPEIGEEELRPNSNILSTNIIVWTLLTFFISDRLFPFRIIFAAIVTHLDKIISLPGASEIIFMHTYLHITLFLSFSATLRIHHSCNRIPRMQVIRESEQKLKIIVIFLYVYIIHKH